MLKVILLCLLFCDISYALNFNDIGVSTVSVIEHKEIATTSVIFNEVNDYEDIYFGELARWKKRTKFIPVKKYGHEENQRIIFDVCSKTDMDYLYFIALALTESSLKENAVGINTEGKYAGSKDQGLFQINNLWQDGYAGQLLESYDVFNPYDNTIMIVNRQFKYFEKYHDYAWCAILHNKGANYKSDNYREEPYVKKVMSYYEDVYKAYLMEVKNGI